jgi:hypothetical protein
MDNFVGCRLCIPYYIIMLGIHELVGVSETSLFTLGSIPDSVGGLGA